MANSVGRFDRLPTCKKSPCPTPYLLKGMTYREVSLWADTPPASTHTFAVNRVPMWQVGGAPGKREENSANEFLKAFCGRLKCLSYSVNSARRDGLGVRDLRRVPDTVIRNGVGTMNSDADSRVAG
jgi:hypothetical protein